MNYYEELRASLAGTFQEPLPVACAEVDRLRQIATDAWQDGLPPVEEGKQASFLCSVNGGKGIKILLYSNRYWAPVSEGVEPNENAEVNEDGDVCWTGWAEESCGQCETFWTFDGTIDGWMPLPAARQTNPCQTAGQAKPEPFVPYIDQIIREIEEEDRR